MKKLIILYFIILALLTIFFGCKKEKVEQPQQIEQGVVTFFMGNYPANNGNWHLILDGKDKGQLKKVGAIPECGDSTYLVITMAKGEHICEDKSMDGAIWDQPVTFNLTKDCGLLQIK